MKNVFQARGSDWQCKCCREMKRKPETRLLDLATWRLLIATRVNQSSGEDIWSECKKTGDEIVETVSIYSFKELCYKGEQRSRAVERDLGSKEVL